MLAFLTNDDRAGYKKFYHEKFYEYFLGRALIISVVRGEVEDVRRFFEDLTRRIRSEEGGLVLAEQS